MIKCPGIATKWYSINHDNFFNDLIIMGILFYSLTSRCSSLRGVDSLFVFAVLSVLPLDYFCGVFYLILLDFGMRRLNRIDAELL